MKTIFLSFSVTNSSVTDYFLELSNQLADSYKVVIIADKIEPHPFVVSPKLEILKWPSDRPKNFSDFWFLFKKTWKYKPDVMISMFGSVNMFLLVGFLLQVKNRIAWSRTISTAAPASKMMTKRKAFVYRLATVVFANSMATKNDLVVNFDVNPKKIRVVYNAVRNYALEKTTNPNKIVYVGSLIPMKGVETLFQAMPAVLEKFPNLKLVVVGGYIGGNSIKIYQEIARKLGIADRVVFLGRQTKPEVLAALSDAYFSVAPSLAEAFGFNVIESFSVKTPVIGSDNTGIAEIIRDHSDGFLFKTKDSVSLSEKMIALLGNPPLRETFSQNCYQRFIETFEVKKAASAVVDQIKML